MRWKLAFLSFVALIVAALGSPSSFDNAIVSTEGSAPEDTAALLDKDEQQVQPEPNGLQSAAIGFSPIYEEEDSCALTLQRKFNCTEEACADLVPGTLYPSLLVLCNISYHVVLGSSDLNIALCMHGYSLRTAALHSSVCPMRAHSRGIPAYTVISIAGYINYLDFFYCTANNIGLQILTFLLFLLWMAFLLHLVETTTNEYVAWFTIICTFLAFTCGGSL
jgi:hypothetical protein